ncbi:BTAD domain-containing putative transcriptional regulator [Streptomyces sp. NPDC102365]|uniref:AfsR/SARP family transcriptional regulator n=1 Tax=Streptomyces sp. NPDC102365 TaxID=3366162 RepID=UPI003820F2C7
MPARAANLLQRHVSGLRRVLEPERPPRAPSGLLVWTEAGHLLTPGPARLDVRTFDDLIERAHSARARGDRAGTAEGLHTALDLWHGRLCEGMTGPLVDAERDRLAERRLSVLEERIEVDLSLGDDFDLVGEIHRLTVEHPLREGFHGLLMLSLHRAGRQAEALAAFHAPAACCATNSSSSRDSGCAACTRKSWPTIRGSTRAGAAEGPTRRTGPADAPSHGGHRSADDRRTRSTSAPRDRFRRPGGSDRETRLVPVECECECECECEWDCD